METVKLKINEITPYEKNAKKHDEKQIKNVMESIKQFGFVQPIVVDKDNVVIIGHCRLLAAKRLKMDEVDAVIADQLTDEQVSKLRLLDNKLNESEWDIDLLMDEVPELNWDGFDVDWGIPDIEDIETEIVEDEPPEPPKEAKTKPGDLYQLGRHRLLCGDATSLDDLQKLLGGGTMRPVPYRPALQCGLYRKDERRSEDRERQQGRFGIQTAPYRRIQRGKSKHEGRRSILYLARGFRRIQFQRGLPRYWMDGPRVPYLEKERHGSRAAGLSVET